MIAYLKERNWALEKEADIADGRLGRILQTPPNVSSLACHVDTTGNSPPVGLTPCDKVITSRYSNGTELLSFIIQDVESWIPRLYRDLKS